MQQQIAKNTDLAAQTKELLAKTQARKSKIVNVFQDIKARAAKGINAELDAYIKSFIGGAKAAELDFRTKRMPITKRFDEIKKMFTAEENEVKALISEATAIRDQFAAKKHKEEQARIQEQEKKRYAENELIEIKKNIHLSLVSYVQQLLDQRKLAILEILKGKDKESVTNEVKAIKTEFSNDVLSTFSPSVTSNFGHDVAAIKVEVVNDCLENLKKHWNTNLTELKTQALNQIDQLFSIDEDEKSDVLEAVKTEQLIESAEVVNAASDKLSNDEAVQKAQVALDSIEVVEEVAKKVSVEIEITLEQAYAVIVQHWFMKCHKEFKGVIARKTLGSMVKDLTKHANKTGERIDSEGIIYVEKVKAK